MDPISSSTFTNTLSVSGLATGLDTDSIVEGLVAIQQRQVQLLEIRQLEVAEQQEAFKNIEARLLTLRGNASSLARTQNGVFDARTVTSSDESVLVGAASGSAAIGSYTFRVENLARAHQIASQGFDSANSEITQGTIQIGIGGATSTITIDSNNNTLTGLANAINQADAGVTAAIINDGGAQPFRLLLSSTQTGSDNAIVLGNNLTANNGDARRPELGTDYVGSVVPDAGFSGTSSVTSNEGAGSFTGTASTTYTFTVTTGGTVGTDNGIEIAYTDTTGTNTGTITVNSTDVDTLLDVAEGIQVQFSSGTLVGGEQFTIDASLLNVQEATDAKVSLGSSAGALTISSDSNQVEDLIPGVTLDLVGADPGKDVTLRIDNNVELARQSILDFVSNYNDFIEFVGELTRFDPETEAAGVLLGNGDVLSIQNQVSITLINTVAGLESTVNRLGSLGISTTELGTLSANEAKLDDVLNGNVEDVTLADVKRLFGLTGETTNPGITFISGSTKTKASETPYQIDLLQAAEQASVTATQGLASSILIDGSNNELTVEVDGQATTLTLTQGTFTQTQLAQSLEAQINSSDDLQGRRVSVNVQSGQLVITSALYGLSSTVAVTGGSALGDLGFDGTETATGQDVAGNFIVDGQIEEAVGTGQFLVGNSGNANTADLQVRVNLASSQILPGIESDIDITRGIASELDVVLGRVLDPVTGRFKTVNTGFQDQIDDIEESITKQNERLEAKRDALIRQFIKLEVTVNQLKTTSSFLTAQLTSIQPFRQDQ